ncbi:acyltransferase [Enterobacter chuandaensis]|uniref:acyltransferase n=1 Tax=Enterobacter chuandaensis TaxID=2497875 RepID=UPI002075AA30|nr:acyltransferase [Enterobacter chuandaensis]MCM7588845.1 acyltransferase [Enterobacter chuandaensis]
MFLYGLRFRFLLILVFTRKIRHKLKAKFLALVTGYDFKMVGKNFKLKIHPFDAKDKKCSKWSGIRIGDNCWIEAVYNYGNQKFQPHLHIGERLYLSDNVHISCVSSLILGNDILIGSKVYIGDHSHGSYKLGKYKIEPPAKKALDDIAPVKIGDCCWIGDNAIILAGTEICDGCVIAANAVVKGLKVEQPCLIGGIPAKVLKVF